MIRTTGISMDLSYEEGAKSALILEPSRVEGSVGEGELFKAAVTVRSADGVRFKAFLVPDNVRIQVSEDTIVTAGREIEITVDMSGFEPGETAEGVVSFSSNLGEYELPVRVTRRAAQADTSQGIIADLYAFTELAKNDYQEAYRLFTSPGFMKLAETGGPSTPALLRGLTDHPVIYQRMEEFMVACGLKDPVMVTAEGTGASFYNVAYSMQQKIFLRRSTWGNLDMDITVDGDFLRVDRRRLTGDDFNGSVYELPYIILHERLGSGRRFGRIVLQSFYQTIVYTVSASREGSVKVDLAHLVRVQRVKLARKHLDYLAGRIDVARWASESLALIGEARRMGEDPFVCELKEAWVLETSGDRAGARHVLEELSTNSFRNQPMEIRAFFLYLCHIAGYAPDGRLSVVDTIRTWQGRNRESFLLLWILLQIDPDMNRTQTKKMFYLEEAFERGTRSPYLYMEALLLIQQDTSRLRRLTPFTRQVLSFAVRQGMMTENIALKTALLADNEKTFRDATYQILTACYDAFPGPDIVLAICRLIVKGEPGKMEYHRWYSLAIEYDLRITRLYEFYVETLPENYQRILPLPVRKYFAMGGELSESKTALLYANIIRNKEQDAATYSLYESLMEAFAVISLERGRINADYAVIYQTFAETLIARGRVRELAEVLFTCQIYTDDPTPREAIVCHDALNGEVKASMSGGTAYLPCYTHDARILFADAQGRRSASKVSCSVKPLMDTARLAPVLAAKGASSPGLLLRLCSGDGGLLPLDAGHLGAFSRMERSEAFSDEFRSSLRSRILAFARANADSEALDSFIKGVDLDAFARADRRTLIEVLIRRGFDAEAFDMLLNYGFEHIAPELLVRLTSRLVKEDGEGNPDLLALTLYVFRLGKYDESMLSYLVEHVDTTLKEMLSVRRRARSFETETFPLDERILRRALFVRQVPTEGGEILQYYVRVAGRDELAARYIAFESETTFQADKTVSPYTASELGRMMDRDRDMPLACRLALLKYYSVQKELTAREENQVDLLMEDAAGKGLRFRFLQDLPAIFLRQYQLEDKVIVEVRAEEDAAVTLHYRMAGPGMGEEFASEPMVQIYDGIFTREFTLFYGEVLEYYVTIRRGDEEERQEVSFAQAPAIDMNGRSRYQLINRMLYTKNEGRTEELRDRMGQYVRTRALIDSLFELEEAAHE